jgi:hypothetical protein
MNNWERFINKVLPKKEIFSGDFPTDFSTGRSSSPDFQGSLVYLEKGLEFVDTGEYKQYIPLIRKLLAMNSSLSLAVLDNVQLCNPGFRLKVDNDNPDKVKKIKKFIRTRSKTWGFGTAGLHGLINRMMFQVFIGGAVSTEWIIKKDKSGIDYPAFVNPEQIEIAYNHSTGQYQYFQRLSTKLHLGTQGKHGILDKVPLNPFTYKYFDLINDQEHPVLIPPFLSALVDIASQKKMLDNINFITDQFGIMGFVELLMSKPNKTEGESSEKYQARLSKFLSDAKKSVLVGLKDGVVAGYEGDHAFSFNSISKDISGVKDIFDINHQMVANGLFTSPSFQGGAMGGSETHITIIFTKMLSQLNNIHHIIKENIEFGIWLELNLAGITDSPVTLEFNKSTITDQLKDAQAKEIEIRNNRVLYADGIISQAQYANALGFEKPDQKEPRVPIDPNKIANDKVAKDKVEKDKDTSDRKSRDKVKPQPKRKDQKTK